MNSVGTEFSRELIDLTIRLRKLLETETNAILSKNIKQIFPLQPKKQSLGRDYEMFCLQIQASPDLIKSWTLPLREQLHQETERLNNVLQENEQALRAIKEVNHLVIETLIKSIVSEKKTVNLYDRYGQSRRTQDKLEKKAVSIRLDERL